MPTERLRQRRRRIVRIFETQSRGLRGRYPFCHQDDVRPFEHARGQPDDNPRDRAELTRIHQLPNMLRRVPKANFNDFRMRGTYPFQAGRHENDGPARTNRATGRVQTLNRLPEIAIGWIRVGDYNIGQFSQVDRACGSRKVARRPMGHNGVAGEDPGEGVIVPRHFVDDELQAGFETNLVDNPADGIIPHGEQLPILSRAAQPVHAPNSARIRAAGVDDLAPAAETGDQVRNGLADADHEIRLQQIAVYANGKIAGCVNRDILIGVAPIRLNEPVAATALGAMVVAVAVEAAADL